MLKSKHGWGGSYIWGKDNCWSNGNWDRNALHSALWAQSGHGLSLVDGAAFVKIEGATLASFAGVEGTSTPWKLVLRDPAGVVALGFIGAVDGAEALGSELVANGTFSVHIAGWTNVVGGAYDTFERADSKLHVVTDGSGAAAGVSDDDIAFVEGKLYKIGFTVGGVSGVGPKVLIKEESSSATARLSCLIGGVLANHGDGGYTYYYTAVATESVVFYFYNAITEGGDFTLDNISAKEVTHVGATGVHIVSAKDGSTRNWASIGAGFDYNAVNYRAEVRRA